MDSSDRDSADNGKILWCGIGRLKQSVSGGQVTPHDQDVGTVYQLIESERVITVFQT